MSNAFDHMPCIHFPSSHFNREINKMPNFKEEVALLIILLQDQWRNAKEANAKKANAPTLRIHSTDTLWE